MRIIFLLIATLLTLSACANKKVKEKIGIVTSGPDEYRVNRNKSLEMPPHYDLLPAPAKAIHNSANKSPKNLNAGEQALIEEMAK